MSAVLLQTTPGAIVTPETPIDAALLNQLGNPSVNIPDGANIGPGQLDMASIGAVLGVGATGSNLALWGDFYPSGWREPTTTAPAGVRTENARGIWVRPGGADIPYNRQQDAPDTLSAWSAYLGGAVGLTSLEVGTYLGPDATSKIRDVPFVIAVSIKNNGNAAFRPSLSLRTSDTLQDEDTVTERILQEADNPVIVGQWMRFVWTLNSTGLTNWINGAQIVFKLQAFASPTYSLLISQIDVRRGTAAADFSVAPREDDKSGAVPVSTKLSYAGMDATAPTGFLFCNGAAVSRSVYANLFAKVGTYYGIGNGVSTFNLPDLRERSPRGISTFGGVQVGGREMIDATGCSINAGTSLLTLGAPAAIPVGSLVLDADQTIIPLGARVLGYSSATVLILSTTATGTASGTLAVRFAPSGIDLRTLGANTYAGARGLIEPRFDPPRCVQKQANCTTGTQIMQTVNAGDSFNIQGLHVGMDVSGTFVPAGTKIESFYSYNQIYLSQAVSATITLGGVWFSEPVDYVARMLWRQTAALRPVIRQCSTANGNVTVTVPIHLVERLQVGMAVSGLGIQAGATIANIISSTQFQMTMVATSTGSGRTLSFSMDPEFLSTPIANEEVGCQWIIKT